RDDAMTPGPGGGFAGSIPTVTPIQTDMRGNPLPGSKPPPGSAVKETLDMSVLSPKKSFNTLPQTVVDQIPYMSRAARQTLFSQYVDVPPGLLDMPRQFTPKQTDDAINAATKIIDGIGSGKTSDVQLASDQIAQLTTLHDGPLSPELATEVINEKMGPM